MDNKKTVAATPIQVDPETADAIIKAVIEKVNAHTDEVLAKMDKKSVAVEKADVRAAVEEVLAEEKKAKETKTEAKAGEPKEEPTEEKKVEIVDSEKKDDGKIKFSWRGFLKYAAIGAAGVGAGAAGKTIYDKIKVRKAAKTEYVDASYDVSADYN